MAKWHFTQYNPNGTLNTNEHKTDLKPVDGWAGNAVDAVKQVGNALGGLADAPYLVDTTGSGKDRTLQTVSTIGEALKENPIVNNPALQAASARFIYASNDAVKANAALDYANKLNIGADVILNSGETGFTRAAYLANQVDRGRTVQSLYDEYPELYKIKYGSQSEAIYSLDNLQSIKSTHGIWDSIQQNVWSINDQMKLGDVGYELSNTTDPKKIEELTNEIQRLQTNLSNYRHADGLDVVQAVIGETAGQGYMMAKQGGIGAVAGAVAGALIGGLATEGVGAGAGAATGAKWGGGADMAYNIYKMSFGNKYIELTQKKDANGNRVYTDQEANQYAMSYAAIDAGIEFAATAAMGKAVKAVAPKGMIAKAISAGVGDTVKTFDRGIGTTVAQMAKNSIKAGVPELFEEGLQDVNEKVQHNLTRKDNDLEGYYSVGDIAIGSLDAMKQALPAVIGFGAIGGAVGGVRTAKAFRDFQKLTPEQQQAAIIAEQNRNGAVIMDNVRKDSTTNKIAKENPELYGKIVQAQGDKIGVSTQYVDVAELVQSENGQLAIRDMVDNGLVTQEEVKAAIEADAPVEIPIGSYAQVSMNLSDETVDALKQTSYFTRGGMSMATLERAKQEVDVAKSVLKDDTSKRAERIKDDIIRNEFEGASDIDREVLNEVLSDPTNIKRNFNNLLHTLKEQYRETYASDFDNADKSINDAVSTGIEPQWLTDYKANNGGKAPRTNAERRRAAYEYSRATTTASLEGNADALAQSDAHYADMEHMLMQIESLEAMKDKVFELANNDIALRMQLSKSGYDVYNEVVKAISGSTNRKQRETAKSNALLMAQHADIMAQYMRQMGKGGYTAMDYFRDSVRINMNAKYDNQKGYNQNTKAVWESKLDKVLSDWANNVDNANNIGSKKTIDIMDSPLVFDLINLDLKRIKITGGVLHKILRAPVFDSNGKRILSGHNDTVSIDMLKQLPNTIANPSAIFSADNGKKIIIITEVIGLNGKPIMMPILLNKYNNRGDYHVVQSYYARNTNIAYYDLLLGGDLIYINKERLSNNPKNQPPWLGGIKLSRSFINSIPNETDLDNLRKKHNYQYYQAAKLKFQMKKQCLMKINISKSKIKILLTR